jgi:aminoglycoside/choline kinase family phosphotransferase
MKEIHQLYKSHFGEPPDKTEEIHLAVSQRRYFRIIRGTESLIGTYSPDVRETVAFCTFSDHFLKLGLNVPEVFAVSDDKQFYLQSDLGSSRLHEIVVNRTSDTTPEPNKITVNKPIQDLVADSTAHPAADSSSAVLDDSLLDLYRLAIDQLVSMQFEGDQDLDYSVAVPRPAFDRQSVLWDMNHFKYYFLKPSGVPFDEQLLEETFEDCANRVSRMEPQGFMFRDFQSRNIMIKDGAVYLIDFQGGRRGPVHYDLASLVFDSKIQLTGADRAQLISYYFKAASQHCRMDQSAFMSDFYLVALVRILQALGAYGLRGKIEKKAVFLQSIPSGLKNLSFLLENLEPGVITDYFMTVLKELAATRDAYRELPEAYQGLTVTIHSFSYRRPGPDDLSGNGGGFVYDCRFVANPGLCDELKALNGFDREVIQFLEDDPEVATFLKSIQQQLERVIQSYLERDYRNLMVSFGCTGGQHRSVFFAHAIAEWCRTLEGVRVLEYHRELNLEG